MSLPEVLSNIFRVKQKSYKMTLILSMIDEWKATGNRNLSLDQVAHRFLTYYKYREANNLKTDASPSYLASHWKDMQLGQVKSLLKTPIDALRSVVIETDNGAGLTFADQVWVLGSGGIDDLQQYANQELDAYNEGIQASRVPLKAYLEQVLNNYVTAKTQTFAGHPLGQLVRRTVPESLRELPYISEHVRVQGSIGQGNWASVPWIAVMDKRMTETTQRGVYIVYLFSQDMSTVYLTLNQGVTEVINDMGRKEGYAYLQQKVNEIRSQLPLEGFVKDDKIELASGGLGRDYQVSTIAYVRYEAGAVPGDEQLLADLENLMENYQLYVERAMQERDTEEAVEEAMGTLTIPEYIKHIKSYIQNKGFTYPDYLIENFYLSLKTKPFVILAGVSGTGKTKLVKLFAEALGATTDNGQFTLIPVRPDWSDPSDLLGYQDISGTFRPGRLAAALLQASKYENRDKPFFICLDEMNLARVEHYFSDILSVLETQAWQDGRIVTEPLIHRGLLTSEEDQNLYGDLSLPDNVYIIGTVNMDETTYPFSKKVLDRAHTIEFNYIHLSQYPEDNLIEIKPSSIPNSLLRSEYLQLVDAFDESSDLIKRTTDRLVRFNSILEQIHAHVGFRIRDAVSFYLIYSLRDQLLTEEAAFDLQILQKILPRIQGSSSSVKRVLLMLLEECIGSTLRVDEYMDDASSLYAEEQIREYQQTAKYPQSARKLAFMLRRLDEDGFTSYWLS